jgi:hypothetical protein
MNYRKVYGGTKVGDESRCDTCIYARIVKGYSESEQLSICDRAYPSLVIPFKVRECSDYVDQRLPEFEQMERIALDLTWVKPSRPAGFKTSSAGKNGSAEETREEVSNEDDEAA